jgi:hypothetical protein
VNLHSYAHFIFDKGAENVWWRKDRLVNKCWWEKWLFAFRKLKLDLCHPILVSTQSESRTLLSDPKPCS